MCHGAMSTTLYFYILLLLLLQTVLHFTCVLLSYEEEDTCMSYEEEDTCMSYEEEDTCMSYEEEDTYLAVKSEEKHAAGRVIKSMRKTQLRLSGRTVCQKRLSIGQKRLSIVAAQRTGPFSKASALVNVPLYRGLCRLRHACILLLIGLFRLSPLSTPRKRVFKEYRGLFTKNIEDFSECVPTIHAPHSRIMNVWPLL